MRVSKKEDGRVYVTNRIDQGKVEVNNMKIQDLKGKNFSIKKR